MGKKKKKSPDAPPPLPSPPPHHRLLVRPAIYDVFFCVTVDEKDVDSDAASFYPTFYLDVYMKAATEEGGEDQLNGQSAEPGWLLTRVTYNFMFLHKCYY